MLYDVVQNLADADVMAPVRDGMARGARRQWMCGLRGTGRSLAVAALLTLRARQACKVQIILTPSQERAETLFTDLAALLGDNRDLPLVLCPSLESLLYEETSPDVQLIRDRMTVLSRLAAGEPLVVIATPDAMLHRTLPPEVLRQSSRIIRANDEVPPAALAAWLVATGYSRVGLVEQPGQFSIRGGVLDVFPSTATAPVRLEFFGDEIESMRVFDPGNQRSRQAVELITLFPAREMLLIPARVERAMPLIRDGLQERLQSISHEPVRIPGERGMEEFLSPADRLSAKIGQELEQMEQGTYYNGVEYYLPYLYPEASTLIDYLPEGATVILDEPEHVAHVFHRFREGLAQVEESRLHRGALLPTPCPLYLSLNDGLAQLARFPEIATSLLAPGIDASFTEPAIKSANLAELQSEFEENLKSKIQNPKLLDGGLVELTCQPPVNYTLVQSRLQPDLFNWVHEQYTLAAATHQEHRMAEMLTEFGVPSLAGEKALPQVDVPAPSGIVLVRRVELSEGIILPEARIVILTDGELLGWQKQRRSIRRHQAPGQALTSVNQLTPGDHVVHINHGIGLYVGMVRREVQGVQREFLQVDYAGADKLFVPVDQLDRVQKYLSLGDSEPEIHRLGSGDWERTKKRTKKSTEELAMQLMKLQAQRSKQQGYPFAPDTPWQREMEEGFPWRETVDQLRAIEEVKADMEQPLPVDRLICGDVGYGKTEVAIRAAFKAIMDGKQVAVLAPTTVLAAQHFRNFRERMAAFPARIALLSRSVNKKEQAIVVGRLKDGSVDIIIGTHRILSKDISFKQLGLVVIDEEQRFGVKQKERFKELQPNVDILTMSATPIPRTLHMALAGLREMSLITTPPEGRMPVRTLALEADDDVLREAILRELDRDGQIFVLHNRISSIYHVAEHIRTIVPQARVQVAHGQMAEGELDSVMMDFDNRQFDVLVCTAIIENGVDFPNVNTLIVDESDTFGLAQLYQLRGRVGRSDRQAYAYLTWKPRKKLTESAQERIAALKEFSQLGAGYQVALRDLEIRGAGNLLGSEQSGVLASVGFDLYCQMLEDAVKMVKGEYIEPEREIQIDLPLDAFLPESYVPELNQRIDLYRRLAAVRKATKAEEIRAEMLDRYGKPLPSQVDNLFRLIGVKLLCMEIGITHIVGERGAVALRLAPERSLSPQAVKRLGFEAPIWRKRGVPAPGFTSGRVTIYTHELDQDDLLGLLEEVADRLRNIEQEVADGTRTLSATATAAMTRRDTDMRPFGR